MLLNIKKTLIPDMQTRIEHLVLTLIQPTWSAYRYLNEETLFYKYILVLHCICSFISLVVKTLPYNGIILSSIPDTYLVFFGTI